MLLMGLSTFVVGLLPGYDQIGVAAPVLLIVMRLIQGLALGGEYGGAATYVAEHAPPGQRGFYTSWIQTTATLGPVPQPDRDPGHAPGGRGGLRGLGLARAVPGLGRAAGGLAVDPAAAQREPGVPADGRRGQRLEGAADRGLRPLAAT